MNNSSFFHWLKGCVYLFIPFLLVYLTVMAVCFGYFFFSPNIVGWSLHNTLDASNCIEVLKNAIAKYGAPEIINSDQGRQFTCLDWKEACREHPEMKNSMDGQGRAKDNIWIERFWRTIKYDYIYIQPVENGAALYQGIDRQIPSKLYLRSAA